MSRISIDVTPQEHQRLKAMAALQGKTIKQFVLASTLGAQEPGANEAQALAELEAVLDARIARAEKDGHSARTLEEVFDEGVAEALHAPDA